MFVGTGLGETDQQKTDRLACAPVGSRSHDLSTMPIRVRGNLRGQVIQLSYGVTVVPAANRGGQPVDWWGCIVVASTNPSYPVGGYDLAVSQDELERGIPCDLPLPEDLR